MCSDTAYMNIYLIKLKKLNSSKIIVECFLQVAIYWESKWGKLLRNVRFDKEYLINLQQFSCQI